MADTASPAAAMPTTSAPAPLTDANILALLDEVNAADSAAGSLASTKGSSESVREFGRMMMRDHHRLRKSGEELAKKINVTPAPPADDTLPASAQRTMQKLNSQPKGPDWDRAYIESEVAVHQGALALLSAAQTIAKDTALRDVIVKVQPLIQGHLSKAQDIQSKLSATPTASTGGAADSARVGANAKKPQ